MMRLRITMMALVTVFGAGCTETPSDDEQHTEIIAPDQAHNRINPPPRDEDSDIEDEAGERVGFD